MQEGGVSKMFKKNREQRGKPEMVFERHKEDFYSFQTMPG